VVYDTVSKSKTMPRGGKRPGAGSKPTWKNGKTKTIRVPIAIAEEVLRLAKELDDKGTIECDTDSKVLDLSGIIAPEIRGRRFVFLDDLLKIGYEIHPLKLAEVVRASLRLSSQSVEKQSKVLNKKE
jgi:hypothetical protein